jgi:hypothetical protein
MHDLIKTTPEELENLAADFQRAEKVMLFAGLEDRFPDEATLSPHYKDCVEAALRYHAQAMRDAREQNPSRI